MSARRLATIDALAREGVHQVLDVRQRRGVRGSEYAWANAKRLQSALMCVERDPEACHRSLVAECLATRHGVSVRHIRP